MNLPVIQNQNVQKAVRSRFGFRLWVMLSPCQIFATVFSLSLAIGSGVGDRALATTPAAKHRAVKAKPVAPTAAVHPAPIKAAPPEAILPPNRIHNMMLPVPTITERLIRDIMVGKPQEAAPPAGTEAFSTEEGSAANSQAGPGQSPQVSPAQSAGDTAAQPAAPGAEAPPVPPAQSATDAAPQTAASASETPSAGEAPAGMAPDAVIPLKPELKPAEESEKPQEKSQLPLDKGQRESAASTIPAYERSVNEAATAPVEPQNATPQQCAAPSMHELLGDGSKQPASTTYNPEDSSNQFDSAGATSSNPAPETQAATSPLPDSPRERIPADGIEGATYAIKTNHGFGSSMVSRESIPNETLIRPLTNGDAPNTVSEGNEVDIDSAVAPAGAAPEMTEPVVAATPSPALPSDETVMDAASSNDGQTELQADVNLGLPSGSILGDIDKEIRKK